MENLEQLDELVTQDEQPAHQQEDGEEGGKPGLLQALEDIVGRSADERMAVFLFEKLGQGRFHESRCRTQQGDDPHPEHGARTADGDGGRHARQVTGSHPGGHRNGESLERRNVLFSIVLAGGIAQQAEHLADHPELYATRLQGKVQRATNQHGNQDVGPEKVVGSRYDAIQPAVSREDIGHGVF